MYRVMNFLNPTAFSGKLSIFFLFAEDFILFRICYIYDSDRFTEAFLF
jgi:hypothetical protein